MLAPRRRARLPRAGAATARAPLLDRPRVPTVTSRGPSRGLIAASIAPRGVTALGGSILFTENCEQGHMRGQARASTMGGLQSLPH